MRGRLLTTREAALRLGVMPETVLRWGKERGLPVIELTSRALRYDEDELDDWVTEQQRRRDEKAPAIPTDAARTNANLPVPAIPLPSAAEDEED